MIPSLFGSYIDETFQRLVQTTGSGTEFADGLGNPITFGQTPTGSLLTTASATGNTITFTKGDGSTFPVTVAGGTGAPGGPEQSLQFNSASVFSGSSNLKYDYVNNNIILTGSLLVTQSHISTVDYVDFTKLPLTSLPAHNEGRLHWYDDTKTLQIDTDKNDFMIEIGHQNVVRVYNDTGIDIPLGKIVRISGSQGNQPTVVTASWEEDSSSAATLGFTATLIAGSGGNRHGYVITNGIIRNVNTLAYSVGTQLYLSSSGQFTSTAPDAPLHEVRLGKVIVSNATTGIIFVDIMNGYELTELHDVKTNGYSDGDLLIRSGSLWTNSKILSGSYTLSGSLTTNDGVSVQTLTASIVSASQITGSLFGTASWANNYNESDPIFVAKSASLATTGSNTFVGNQIVSGAVIATGEYITSTFYKVNGENGTLTYVGDDGGDGVMYINSYDLTGSLNINTGGFYKVFDENATKSTQIIFYEPPTGISIYFPSSSGTLTTKVNGTGSNNGGNITLNTIPTSSYVNPLNQNVIITGSLTVSGSSTFTNIGPTVLSGSVTTTDGFTGSLQGTASFATTASYALTAAGGTGGISQGKVVAIVTGYSNLF